MSQADPDDSRLSPKRNEGHEGDPADPVGEERAKTIEAKQPWLKLGMSRRTWYRRQAEKRAARIEFQP